VRPFIPVAYRPESYLHGIPGTGLIIALIALTLLGFLTANLVGRTLVEAGERILRLGQRRDERTPWHRIGQRVGGGFWRHGERDPGLARISEPWAAGQRAVHISQRFDTARTQQRYGI